MAPVVGQLAERQLEEGRQSAGWRGLPGRSAIVVWLSICGSASTSSASSEPAGRRPWLRRMS